MAGLDGCRKISPPPGFAPRVVDSVACRYTNWTIPGTWESEIQVFKWTNSTRDTKPSLTNYMRHFVIFTTSARKPAHINGCGPIKQKRKSLLYKIIDKYSGFGVVIYSILYYPCTCLKPVAIIHVLLHGDTVPPTVIDINRQQSRLILIYRSMPNYRYWY